MWVRGLLLRQGVKLSTLGIPAGTHQIVHLPAPTDHHNCHAVLSTKRFKLVDVSHCQAGFAHQQASRIGDLARLFILISSNKTVALASCLVFHTAWVISCNLLMCLVVWCERRLGGTGCDNHLSYPTCGILWADGIHPWWNRLHTSEHHPTLPLFTTLWWCLLFPHVNFAWTIFSIRWYTT